ncbi:MAG: LytTR family transcriptional regulator DNA-binding domain-containing protein [Bacillota bacterium]|nr:LytTR family transcriptional regulator DNA-binding domain-containing protein [Bacillota bacterium]
MSREKILVVEDQNLIALEIKKRLENNNFIVAEIISNGKEAVDYVSKHDVDLILMDIMLDDEMDGIDAAKKINENNDIPIIYLTAYSDDKTLEKAKETMSYGYIIKPIEEDKLKINIEMALNKHRLEKIGLDENMMKDKTFLIERKISIKNEEEIILINLNNLIYIEVEEGVVYFYTDEEKLSEKGTLKYWEEKLEEFRFYRCHKNFIINLNKIEKLIPGKNNSYLLKMNNYKRDIPIARDKIKEIKDIITI